MILGWCHQWDPNRVIPLRCQLFKEKIIDESSHNNWCRKLKIGTYTFHKSFKKYIWYFFEKSSLLIVLLLEVKTWKYEDPKRNWCYRNWCYQENISQNKCICTYRNNNSTIGMFDMLSIRNMSLNLVGHHNSQSF